MADVLVGIHYFAGWWRSVPNKWHSRGVDWRPDWPGRVPLLGEYNEQETMDREIVAAAEHAVDFFQILWYPVKGRETVEPGAVHLNDGLTTFMASPQAHRLRFTLEAVNHPPFGIATVEEWEACCREWAAALTHPSYLRLDGRPAIKIHGFHQFWMDCGQDPAEMQRRVDILRRCCWEAEAGDPLVAIGTGAGGLPPAELLGAFDWLATYMDVPDLPQRAEPYPYEELLAQAQGAWRLYAEHSPLPYVPYLPAGWDPRPWRDRRASFDLPDREQWTAALRAVKAAVEGSDKLGFPGGLPAFLVYAWNEFGEGGIVAPTAGDQYMKLEAIREVFGAA